MCSVSAERCQPESHHSSWCSVALVSPSVFSEGAENKGGVCVQLCVSASDGGQQGPRCDREGGTGPLGAVTAGGQGDFLPAVQWNREDVTASLALYETDAMNQCSITDSWNTTWLLFLIDQLLLIVLLLSHCGDAILKWIIWCIHLHYLET